uniref:Protein kinase putative n=1 Tax=Albugo laibachii Nc14 TaxID=890382 RepID=F0W3X7_9STRA|nr:protein kinase putative [Albugo laibachii Nc14]|eukprot:CCA15772.1 protein kinase putative [Albugo laibachii Nc14]
MVFTRCMSGEPDHSCPTRRNQCNSDHTVRRGVSNSSSRFRLRHLLKWKIDKNETQATSANGENNPEKTGEIMEEWGQQLLTDVRIDTLEVTKLPNAKTSLIQRCSSAPPMHRQDERSLVSFHQEYAIVKHIGAGSYSTVKRVIHRKSGESYACKIVDKISLSPIDRLALRHELEVLRFVDHDHIMKLYDVIEDDTKCYMVLELVEHGDLFDRVVKQGRVKPAEAQEIAAGLVHALHYCHTNAIIHRDIKPENVLIHREAGVKLCDFGFAKRLKKVSELSADSCGTPGYAAPEILDGKLYGIEVDIFSLGVVIYIILCGYPPFPMKLSQLRAHKFRLRFPSKDWIHIDPSIRELLSKILQVDPANRPKTSDLVSHPWIAKGKEMLDTRKARLYESRTLKDHKRKDKLASALEKKLRATETGSDKCIGVTTVKHENGESVRTKLVLSADGSTLRWQRNASKYEPFRLLSRRALSSFFRRSPSTLSNQITSSQTASQHVDSKSHEGSKLHPFSHLHPALRRLNDLEGFQVQRKPTSKMACHGKCSCPPPKETRTSSANSLPSSPSIRKTFSQVREQVWWKKDLQVALTVDSGRKNDLANPTGKSVCTADLTIQPNDNDSAFSGTVQDQTRGLERASSFVELENITQIQLGNPLLHTDSFHRDEVTQQTFLYTPTGRRECLSAARPSTSCVLSLKTSENAIHLEFTDQDTRDAFSYLIDRLCREQNKAHSESDQNQEEHELKADAHRAPEECFQTGFSSEHQMADNGAIE